MVLLKHSRPARPAFLRTLDRNRQKGYNATVTDSVTMAVCYWEPEDKDVGFEKLSQADQDNIINSASEVFAKYGYQKASMQDIAQAAHVSKSVLFKYFATKENLYQAVFAIAAQQIQKADSAAFLPGQTDLFTRMRQSARARFTLFKAYPWMYRFAYAAAFDPHPLVRTLVEKQMNGYRSSGSGRQDDGGTTSGFYQGLRMDITPAMAGQMIVWISQGYLQEKLLKGETDPEQLQEGFAAWIDTLETLLKSGQTKKEEKNE